jgi:FkbM family methyltransferase
VKIILAAALAASALAATFFFPPARLALFALTGRSTNCPLPQAVRSAQHLADQIRIKDEILAASKLMETDSHGFKLYSTPMGRYWIPKGSEFVLPFNLAEVKREIYFSGEHRIKPGDIVLDCGANIGVFTRRALEMGAAKVIAIEPGPENVECLRRNFQQEVFEGRVVVYAKGVWDKNDFLDLNVDPNNSAADSFLIKREGSRTVARVPLTTIDNLTAELGLPRVDFIKMDIEGAEPQALNGALDTLRRHRPRLSISAYHADDHPVVIPAKVRAAHADYAMECGPCAEISFGVRPDILYFR